MENHKRLIFYHLFIPILTSILFFINAAMPVTVLGCANRGWVAFIVALVSLLAALYTATVALQKRWRQEADSTWWIISTLILSIPAVALLILA
jgi:hypothetical protein